MLHSGRQRLFYNFSMKFTSMQIWDRYNFLFLFSYFHIFPENISEANSFFVNIFLRCVCVDHILIAQKINILPIPRSQQPLVQSQHPPTHWNLCVTGNKAHSSDHNILRSSSIIP
jgi:hypothetical protein